MSTNTIKIGSNTGEIFISPQTTKTYKDISLFGYGYLDWGRIINQSLVSLMDKLDIIESNGVSKIEFDLESFEETQKSLRTEEFKNWKLEYVNTLRELIVNYENTINSTIDELEKAQNLINDSVSQELIDINLNIKNNYDTITNNMSQKIVEVVNNNLSSMTDKLAEVINNSTIATQSLNQTKNKLEQQIVEFNKNIETFKTTFTESFTQFKDDINNTLSQNKTIILQYIDEKLTLIKNNIESNNDRIDSLELLVEDANVSNLQNIITDKVDSIATTVINNYIGSFTTKLNNMETTLSNYTLNLNKNITDVIDTKLIDVNDKLDVFENKFVLYDNKFVNINSSLLKINNWVEVFDTAINDNFDSVENFMTDILISKNSIILENSKSTNLLNIIKKVTESIIKQTEANNINMIKYLDKLNYSVLKGLRNTYFNENDLIIDITERNNLAGNGLNNLTFENIFLPNTDLNFVDFGYSDDSTNTYLTDLYFTLKIPSGVQNTLYTTLKIYFDGYVFPDTLTNYIETPLFIIPRATIARTYLDEVIPNYDTIINSVKSKDITPATYYKDTQTSSLIFAKIPEELKVLKTSKLRFKIGSKEISVIPSEIFTNTSVYFIDKIAKTISEYDTTTSNIFNNLLIPFADYNSLEDEADTPVKRIISKNGRNILHLKINLPSDSEITSLSLVTNDDPTPINISITNREKFKFDIDDYTNSGYNSTINYYKDISTTGLMKINIGLSQQVVGTISYKVNGVPETKTFIAGELPKDKKFSNISINPGQYIEYNMDTDFNGFDTNNIIIQVAYIDQETSSPTNGMKILNKHSDVVIRNSKNIRIYNTDIKVNKYDILLKN